MQTGTSLVVTGTRDPCRRGGFHHPSHQRHGWVEAKHKGVGKGSWIFGNRRGLRAVVVLEWC
jgi:hypothetical protein